MNRPRNVLFIIADQWRADCLGRAGHSLVKTPHLDALADEGTSFENCFTQTAPCGPSRMCIYTGRYPCSTRSRHNCTPLSDADDNLAWYLRQAGHEPGLAGYNDYAVDPGILPDDDPRTKKLDYDNFLPGFDVVLDHEYDCPEYFEALRTKGYPEELLNRKAIHAPNVPPDYKGDRPPFAHTAHYKEEDSECRFLTDAAINHIRSKGEQPWVLSLNYIKPHPPRICCAPYHQMYDPAEVPPAVRKPEELASTHPYLKNLYRDNVVETEEGMREVRANYYGMISEVDANIGRLLQTLKDQGLWEETLIVFSSDHGEYLGDHYLLNKGHFYDSSLQVPLIVRDPSSSADATRGKRIQTLVESIDTTPTIMDWLGVPIPSRVQGQSYLDLIHGKKEAKVWEEVHYEFSFRRNAAVYNADPDSCMMWVIRDHAFKYVQFGIESIPPLLFDLRKDPGEFENLAGRADCAATELAYAQRMLRWRMRNEDYRMEHWADGIRAQKHSAG